MEEIQLGTDDGTSITVIEKPAVTQRKVTILLLALVIDPKKNKDCREELDAAIKEGKSKGDPEYEKAMEKCVIENEKEKEKKR